jgi:hypothetical protein
MRKVTVLAALLGSPNLDASEAAYADLASGLVDPRLVEVLAGLLARHRLRIEMIKTGHPLGPRSRAGVENTHYFYRAADIYAVDGQRVSHRPVPDAVIEAGHWLMALPARTRVDTVMGPAPWHAALGPGDRAGFRNDDFANRIHNDHLHLGMAQPGQG